MSDQDKDDRIAVLEKENEILRQHLKDVGTALVGFGKDVGNFLAALPQVKKTTEEQHDSR